ncbi:hypothetical protein [Streptomyces sp. KL116D]|uniref:hypothetical protein n=1 Tax=Streptomyces sp. KL116D TaxID=3045152 RepID=UPI003557A575
MTTFAADSACAAMVRISLAPENIHAARLIVPGAIRTDRNTHGIRQVPAHQQGPRRLVHR